MNENSDVKVKSDLKDTLISEINNNMPDAEIKREKRKRDQETIMKKQALAKEAEILEKEKWYKHLQKLLSRSQFYSKLLDAKIEKQRLANEKLDAQTKEVKGIEKMEQKIEANSQVSCETETPPLKRRRKSRKLSLSPEELENMAPIVAPIVAPSSSILPKRQPQAFVGEMRDYQLDGVDWLNVLYEHGINGILADEMGLGKTIQIIALITSLLEQNECGPFLVSAPLSTLGNWKSEFSRFAPSVKTIVYHGNKVERKAKLRYIRKKTVVITSYELIMNDRSLLDRYKWHYIIVDEGHRLKNPDCKFVRDLKQYRSDNRLLLTGTPLQNNLIELWSLLNFLMPDLFDDLNVFQSWFDVTSMEHESGNIEIIAQEREKHIIATLHQILTPFLLRRTKAEVKLNLPPKKELLVYARMSTVEENYYKASLSKNIGRLLGVEKEEESRDNLIIETKRKRQRHTKYSTYFESDTSDDESFEKVLLSNIAPDAVKADSPVKKITSVVNLKLGSLMMHLKKIVTHPYLLEYPLTPEGDYLVDENLINNSGKLRVLDCLLKGLKKGNHKVLIFSQMTSLLDILHDYCVYRGYKFCRLDGNMTMEDRDENIKIFNEDEDIFIFLLSTRAGGLGLNLASADTVIIYDSDWNPQCDLQAQDRCHRYGQSKPVMIYRLITRNSIDEKVVNRANAKRKLEKMIMMKGRFSGKDSPALKNEHESIVEHLEDLLKKVDNQVKVLPQDGEVFTDEQLAALLDRSQNGSTDVNDIERCFKVVNQNMPEEEVES